MNPPQLSDGEGVEWHGPERLPFDAWEMRCLLEIADARAENRRVSFKIPMCDHAERNGA